VRTRGGLVRRGEGGELRPTDREQTAWERSISTQIGSRSLVGAGSTVTLPRGKGGDALPELEEGQWCSRNNTALGPGSVGEGRRGKQVAAGRGWARA
jgi:hypothetical protein